MPFSASEAGRVVLRGEACKTEHGDVFGGEVRGPPRAEGSGGSRGSRIRAGLLSRGLTSGSLVGSSL